MPNRPDTYASQNALDSSASYPAPSTGRNTTAAADARRLAVDELRACARDGNAVGMGLPGPCSCFTDGTNKSMAALTAGGPPGGDVDAFSAYAVRAAAAAAADADVDADVLLPPVRGVSGVRARGSRHNEHSRKCSAVGAMGGGRNTGSRAATGLPPNRNVTVPDPSFVDGGAGPEPQCGRGTLPCGKWSGFHLE